MLKWKHESGGLCRCCLAEGAYKNLSSVFNWMQEREVYSEMLKEVFDISLTHVETQEQDSGLWSICDECVGKLREANTFKKKVLASENRFRELYHPSNHEIEIKSEEPDPEVKSEDYVSTGADDLDTFLDSEDEFLATASKRAKKTKSKPEKESQPKKKRGRKPKAKVKEEEESNADNSSELKAEEAAGPADENDAQGDESAKSKQGPSEQPKKKGARRSNVKFEVGVHYDFVDANKPNDKVICLTCKKEVGSRNTFYRHYKRHIKKEPEISQTGVTCGACGIVLKNKVILRLHVRRIHLMEKNRVCVTCGYRSFDKKRLNDHMISHTGEKKHVCKFCNKRFARQTALVYHERIHTGDKRKTCTLCGAAFVQKASLNYHMVNHHHVVCGVSGSAP